jgi:uncharacterized membrane protein YqiK
VLEEEEVVVVVVVVIVGWWCWRRRSFICDQIHASVCKQTRRSPNAVARHRLK